MIEDRDITPSVSLQAHIRQRMADNPNKAISFLEYMECCLYHPQLGYYMRDTTKLGKEGDYYTSSSIGTVMGDMLAEMYMRYAADEPRDVRLKLVEWGGGNGKLAGQLLDRLRSRDPELYDRTELIMIEYSDFHRGLQRQQLDKHRHVSWMSEDEWRRGAPWQGIFVWANELLDAFPVHRIVMLENGLHEIWVGWDEARNRYKEVYRPIEGEAAEYMHKHGIALQTGQIGDINTAAVKWIKQLGQHIESGQMTIIDYGDEAEEIYAPHRMRGTLMCYRQHQASDQPYVYPGEQDMTTHVDFTACRRAAEEAGFTEVRLETQLDYLVRGGVLEWLQDHHDPDPFSPAARRNRSIRQLLLSDRMSELFKVLTARK